MAMPLFAVLFVHVLAGALYNKYRLQQLLKYIHQCRGRELTEGEFSNLRRRYTSFLAASRFSPSRSQFPALYTNADFAAFARQSKQVMMYIYAVAIPCAFMWMVLV